MSEKEIYKEKVISSPLKFTTSDVFDAGYVFAINKVREFLTTIDASYITDYGYNVNTQRIKEDFETYLKNISE